MLEAWNIMIGGNFWIFVLILGAVTCYFYISFTDSSLCWQMCPWSLYCSKHLSVWAWLGRTQLLQWWVFTCFCLSYALFTALSPLWGRSSLILCLVSCFLVRMFELSSYYVWSHISPFTCRQLYPAPALNIMVNAQKYAK